MPMWLPGSMSSIVASVTARILVSLVRLMTTFSPLLARTFNTSGLTPVISPRTPIRMPGASAAWARPKVNKVTRVRAEAPRIR
ncbi:hypothetical protein D3C84_862530 [compost metagenome]